MLMGGIHRASRAQTRRPHPESLGTSRVGPFGLLQPLVDGAKSFLKEDLIPTAVYRPIYLLAPIISLGCALIAIAVVPFGARYGPPRRRPLSNFEHQRRPACHSRRHLDRRLRHRAGRLVFKRQIFPARIAALLCPGSSLRTRARPFAGRRRPPRRIAQSPRHRGAAGHSRRRNVERPLVAGRSWPSSFI